MCLILDKGRPRSQNRWRLHRGQAASQSMPCAQRHRARWSSNVLGRLRFEQTGGWNWGRVSPGMREHKSLSREQSPASARRHCDS